MDDDYETALMWQTEQDLQCPGCGQPRDEVWVFGPDDQRVKREKWQAGIRKCVGCAHAEAEDKARRDLDDKFGNHVTLERTGDG